MTPGAIAPVVLLFYNRPKPLREVFAAISEARPSQLFLVADGPKDQQDAQLCAAARAVVERVDWPCTVHRNYADVNMGTKLRVPSGLDWVFGQVEEAIILEDDCVPSLSFFPFCTELLNRFRDDTRIMEIAGSNYQMGRRCTPYSYYFSRYWSVWGWATWRRAWAHFDVHMRRWPELRDAGFLDEVLPDRVERDYWSERFNSAYSGRFTRVWDWQWLFTIWRQNGLSVVPELNLITNIGFGPDATNYKTASSPFAFQPRHEITEIRHPPDVFPHRKADRFTFDYFEGGSVARGLPGAFRRLARTLWRSARMLFPDRAKDR